MVLRGTGLQLDAVQQFSLNQKMKSRNMTTLQLRKSIAVMFISAFAVSASFAAPTDSPQPTPSSAQSSQAQTTRPMKSVPGSTSKMVTNAAAGRTTQKAEGEARVRSKIVVLNRNKAECKALGQAIKGKDMPAIGRILQRNGFDTGHEPVMQVRGYCVKIFSNGMWYWLCADPELSHFAMENPE